MSRVITAVAFVILSAALAVAYFLFGANSAPKRPVLYGDVLLGAYDSQTRHLLRFMVRGEEIFLDTNGDNIPQATEELTSRKTDRLEKEGATTSYQVTNLDLGVVADAVSESLTQKLILTVDIIKESHQYSMSGKLELSEDPTQTNWLHYGGPVQFLGRSKLELKKRSSEPSTLQLFIGTVARGPSPLRQDSEQTNMVANDDDVPNFRTTILIPTERPPFPNASIEFSLANGETKAQEFTLDHFC